MTSLGVAGGTVATPAAAGSRSRTLTLASMGGRFGYAFSVSGSLERSDVDGTSIGSGDTITGSTAAGQGVGGEVDSYSFTGEIESFQYSGSIEATVDGRRVYASRYPNNVLSIEATGPHANYDLSVSDSIEKSTANGGSIGASDVVSGSTVTGAVANTGVDSYVFDGEIESLSYDEHVRVTLNGERVYGSHYPGNVLSIEATGPHANYDLSVSGSIEKSTANGGSIGASDVVSGSTVTGAVASTGVDSYVFDGEIESLSYDEHVRVTLNGERVYGSHYPGNVLSIEGTGPHVTYGFTVSGDLEKSTANGATINGGDEVTGSTATGAVSSSTDSYTFDGELVEIHLDGDATVTRNGEEIDPNRGNLLSIEGTGTHVEYSFTVSGELEKSAQNGATIGGEDHITGSTATGSVGGGTDSYVFQGRLETISADGPVDVTLNGSRIEYDRSGSWIAKADLPQNQSDASGGVLDGRLYYFGGFAEGPDLDAVKRTFAYEPEAGGKGSWKRLEDFPRALWAPCGVTTEDAIYSFGGAPSGSPYNGVSPSDEIFRYRPGEGWTDLTARTGVRCPYPNYTMGGVYNPDDGLIYCMGGGTNVTDRDSAVTYDDRRRPGTFDESRIWTFDPGTERVANPDLARMPRAKRWLTSGLVEVHGRTRIHAIGGRFGPSGPTDTNFRFDVERGTWSRATPSPIAGTFATTRDSVIDDRIYLTHARTYKGDSPNEDYTTRCYRYDPVHDEYDHQPNADHRRGGSVSGVIGETLYVAGGHLKRYNEDGGYHDCVRYTSAFTPR